MEAENDALNLIVKKAQKENQINVHVMEEENDVSNRIVIQAHKAKLINV